MKKRQTVTVESFTIITKRDTQFITMLNLLVDKFHEGSESVNFDYHVGEEEK